MTVGMMLRFIQADITGRLQGLGRFKLKGNKRQAEAALALYNLFIETRGKPDIPDLRRLQHNLFDALLRAKGLSEHAVACPTDQMLFLRSIIPDGGYHGASTVTNVCCFLTFCFRSILVHISRLLSEQRTEYSPYERQKDATCDNNDSDYCSEEHDDDEEDDLDDHIAGQSSDSENDEDVTAQLMKGALNPERDCYFKLISSL